MSVNRSNPLRRRLLRSLFQKETPSLSLRLRFRGFRRSPPDNIGHPRISTGHRPVSSALVRLPSRYRPSLVRRGPALSGPLFTHHTADPFVTFGN